LLNAKFEAAEREQTPQAWRAVVAQGRDVRTALESNGDGVEHKLYHLITRLTDTADKGLESAASDGREVYSHDLINTIKVKLQALEDRVDEDRKGRGLFEGEIKRHLDEVKQQVSTAKKALFSLSLQNPTFAVFSTGIAELAALLKLALTTVEKYNLVDKIKAAGRQVRTATGQFLSDMRARVTAFKLPWPGSAAEGYFEPERGFAFIVRNGGERFGRAPGARCRGDVPGPVR
jgi:hypothetical protein